MASAIVELRSDTFTMPGPGMRRAMAEAVCGDDMVGEDPTVNALEARMADLLGKEAAVFACSGSQSNQMAVWSHCRSGDELLIEETGHIANYEGGGPAVLSGVSCRKIRGERGGLNTALLNAALRPPNQHFSPTRLVCLENSTNIGGGATYVLEQLKAIRTWADEKQLLVHIDGARLFNACIARGYSAREVAAQADTVSICFSKGLGCPMGSVLVGSRETISRARRARKVFGGALRQAGFPAAACLYALDHHINRLAEDHANARFFAEQIAQIPGVKIAPHEVETNLVFFEIDSHIGPGAAIAAALKERGINLYAIAPQRLRACFHLDVDRAGAERAVVGLREVVQSGACVAGIHAGGNY
ncbi:MAG: aminotransferase class I/II-fold pyridoxal phosphate-dependent enzyme [Planctomycetota bacterium]|nr:MAG: aminotransferase class I/II-fold pyridoxal phosphate-dependent enzyme [Planctomycetota bacterium]